MLLPTSVNDTLMLLTEGGACTYEAEREDTYTIYIYLGNQQIRLAREYPYLGPYEIPY